MDMETFLYREPDGWSMTPLPALDSEQTLVIAFGTNGSEPILRAIAELKRSYPASRFIGCSTAGEIFNDSISDNTLTVAVMRFRQTRLASFSAPSSLQNQSFDAGRAIAAALRGEELRAILVLAEGLAINGSELVNGINSVLPGDVVVTGGLAGDGDRFAQTWVLDGRGELLTGHTCAIGFYGDAIRVNHGSKGGWDIFGPQRRVTRARDNVLFELDGKPALDLYKLYLGERASGLPATGLLFPLSLHQQEPKLEAVVRTILAVNEKENSIIFAGNIPEGSTVQLMRANFDRLIDGAADAASMIRAVTGMKGPLLSIAISCVGRRLILGERAEEEVEATLEHLPPQTMQVGFYSYGEISPSLTGLCDLHNQTMTLTTIHEE